MFHVLHIFPTVGKLVKSLVVKTLRVDHQPIASSTFWSSNRTYPSASFRGANKLSGGCLKDSQCLFSSFSFRQNQWVSMTWPGLPIFCSCKWHFDDVANCTIVVRTVTLALRRRLWLIFVTLSHQLLIFLAELNTWFLERVSSPYWAFNRAKLSDSLTASFIKNLIITLYATGGESGCLVLAVLTKEL